MVGEGDDFNNGDDLFQPEDEPPSGDDDAGGNDAGGSGAAGAPSRLRYAAKNLPHLKLVSMPLLIKRLERAQLQVKADLQRVFELQKAVQNSTRLQPYAVAVLGEAEGQ